jgi:hypothetical protein
MIPKEKTVKIRILICLLAVASIPQICRAQGNWQQMVKDELPLLGHRNWIVVVDSAYPLQTSPGIETVSTDANQLDVLDFVLNAISHSEHVRPIVHTDKELEFVDEHDAPGVEKYREDLKTRLSGLDADSMLHDDLIAKLKETGASFHVLILKTKMTIPYTSVFIQLDCRYWSAASEVKLREAMKKAAAR